MPALFYADLACKTQNSRYISARELLSLIFNGSLSLAGLLLVFMGFVYAHAQSFPPGTAASITARYKNVAKAGLLPFALALANVLLALHALRQRPITSVEATISLFVIEVIVLLLYAVTSVLWYLR